VGAVLAITSELNCPAGHVYEMHAEVAGSVLYVPAGHAVHSPTLFSKYPDLHFLHDAEEVVPVFEFVLVFAGHGVQAISRKLSKVEVSHKSAL